MLISNVCGVNQKSFKGENQVFAFHFFFFTLCKAVAVVSILTFICGGQVIFLIVSAQTEQTTITTNNKRQFKDVYDESVPDKGITRSKKLFSKHRNKKKIQRYSNCP